MNDTATASVSAGRRLPRWAWLALVVSVALNLLLVGLMAGAAWFRHRTGLPFGAAASQYAFIRSLPRERREEIRQASRERLASVRPLWQSVREARREADRLLTAEPFDAAAFLAAHRRMLERESEARFAGSQILAEAAARLTPDERRQMLSWRERHRSRWRGDGASSTEGPGR